MKLPRRALALLIGAPAALLAPGTLSSGAVAAPPVLEGVGFEIAEAVKRRCQAELLTGAAGTRLTPYIATEDGVVSARLTGASGDWDLAAFDTVTGKRIGASATMGARELVSVPSRRGQSTTFQACRRTGGSPAAAIAIDLTPAPEGAAPATPPQLVEIAVEDSREAATLEGYGFDTTHNRTDSTVEAIITSPAQTDCLRRLGYSFEVTEPDLPALARRVAAQDVANARLSQRRALPSERTTYREYADYGTDLKELVETYPGHVKAVNLGPSLDGQPIEGVEITTGVGRPGDGRPIFVLGGLTHAREWPSGDTAMEFAIEAAESLAPGGTNPRLAAMLAKTRVIVLPVQNPDGFAVSRQAGALMASGDDRPPIATVGEGASDSGAYKRKNCRAANAAMMALPCASRGPNGVDLNRAYSAYWGGPGSSSDMTSQAYRGTAPLTEPEALAIRRFGDANQIQVYVTQHTHDPRGRWLRQPGFDAPDDEVPPTVQDEPAMAGLGQAMADATDYESELGYATLGNITGPADDFLYYLQGTYGYTPELRGSNFHTNFANAVVAEYEGVGAKAGRGLREAYIVAGERAANTPDHVVVKGSAPAGKVLRLKKTTDLRSYSQNGQPFTKYPETINTVLTVPASGDYEWHVNPSTRPLLPLRSEAFTFTCEEPDGTVLETQSVTADRGDVLTRDFACGLTPPPTPTDTTSTPTTTTPTTTTTTTTPTETTTTPATSTPTTSTPARTPVPPAPGATVAPVAGLTTASILRPRFSARRTKRLGGLNLYLRLRGGGLRDVKATIVDARGRVLLSGGRAVLPTSGRVPLKRRGMLRPGSVRVVVSAFDGRGRRVTAALRSRIVR